jgi:exodeoxyribonuclease-3
MKIVSWNVNSINARIDHLRELVVKENPDIILLQEIKSSTENFPYSEFADFNYEILISGQKSYNGVAIFSKYKILSSNQHFPNNPLIDHARFIEIECDTIFGTTKIISLYAPNGGDVDSEKFKQKFAFYKEFNEYLKKIHTNGENIIIGGDFNIAPFDIDVYDTKILRNSTGFTCNEKKIIRNIFSNGLNDLYRLKHPNSQEFSWWDYREGGFEQNKGMRIDFIIANNHIANYIKDSRLLKNYRAKVRPSDHIPMIVEFEFS